MNLLDDLLNVDRSESNENYVELFDLGDELGVSGIGYGCNNTELKSYWLKRLNDTDTYVGIQALYLRGNLVGYIDQSGRKSSPVYYWCSEKSAMDVTVYLLELVAASEFVNVKLIDEYIEIDERFRVGDYDRIDYEKFALYEGEWVEIVDYERPGTEIITIQFDDGEQMTLNISELEFTLRLR